MQGSGNPIICRFRPILNSWDRFIFQKMLFYRSETNAFWPIINLMYFPIPYHNKICKTSFCLSFFLNRSIIHRFSQSTPHDYSRVKLLIVQLSKHCSKTTESCPNCLSRFAARLANKQVSVWLKPITLTIVRAELYSKDRQN